MGVGGPTVPMSLAGLSGVPPPARKGLREGSESDSKRSQRRAERFALNPWGKHRTTSETAQRRF
jgi:hypothetical protein